MMLLYSIVDDYGVCDRDGVGDAVASVWLIADASVWLIADASVRLIDDASLWLIADALNGGGVWLIADAIKMRRIWNFIKKITTRSAPILHSMTSNHQLIPTDTRH